MRIRMLALLMSTMLLPSAAWAVGGSKPAPAKASSGKGAAPAASGKAGGKAGGKAAEPEETDFPLEPEEPAVVKEFTRGEIQAICKRYTGQLIAYYGDVYKVEGCSRRPIVNNKTVYQLQRDGQKVLDVSGDVIAALPEGDALDFAQSKWQARTCKQLEGQYVTFSNVDVYFVEHCRKRIFPDWETYIRHREKRGDKKGEILALSWVEFDQLRAGQDVPSVIDDMFKKLLTGEAGVDVIPVDEACEGIEGKIVSYYARLYKVEHCRKREILDTELYVKKTGIGNIKLIELRSEQWLSLPNGKPIDEKPAKPVKPDTTAKR